MVHNPELITKWQADEAEFSAAPPLSTRAARGAATLQPTKPVPTVVAPRTDPALEEGTEEAEGAPAAAAAVGAASAAVAPVAATQRLRPGMLQPVADPESIVIKSQRAITRRSPTGTRRTRAGAARAGATAEVRILCSCLCWKPSSIVGQEEEEEDASLKGSDPYSIPVLLVVDSFVQGGAHWLSET